MRYAIALMLALALPAHAGGWGDNTEANANARQSQEQTQRATQTVNVDATNRNNNRNTNRNTNRANSNSGASSDSNSSSYSSSGASSYSGGSNAVAEGGQQSTSVRTDGGSSTSAGGNSVVDIDASDSQAASSAASVYASRCTNSASAQGMGGGGAVATGGQLCDHKEIAHTMLLAYQQQVQWCKDGSDACDPAARTEHLAAYNYHLQAANDLVENTETTGFINRISGQIALPAAMLWVLFLL